MVLGVRCISFRAQPIGRPGCYRSPVARDATRLVHIRRARRPNADRPSQRLGRATWRCRPFARWSGSLGRYQTSFKLIVHNNIIQYPARRTCPAGKTCLTFKPALNQKQRQHHERQTVTFTGKINVAKSVLSWPTFLWESAQRMFSVPRQEATGSTACNRNRCPKTDCDYAFAPVSHRERLTRGNNCPLATAERAPKRKPTCRISTVVVQRFCKPKVAGSNPASGTILQVFPILRRNEDSE